MSWSASSSLEETLDAAAPVQVANLCNPSTFSLVACNISPSRTAVKRLTESIARRYGSPSIFAHKERVRLSATRNALTRLERRCGPFCTAPLYLAASFSSCVTPWEQGSTPLIRGRAMGPKDPGHRQPTPQAPRARVVTKQRPCRSGSTNVAPFGPPGYPARFGKACGTLCPPRKPRRPSASHPRARSN